jgi:hypothetical protein
MMEKRFSVEATRRRDAADTPCNGRDAVEETDVAERIIGWTCKAGPARLDLQGWTCKAGPARDKSQRDKSKPIREGALRDHEVLGDKFE